MSFRESVPADHTRRSMKGEVTLILNCLRSGGAEKQLLWVAEQITALGMPCSVVELVSGERTERIEAMVRDVAAKGVRILRAPSGSRNLRGFWRLRLYLHETKPALIWSWGLRADLMVLLSRPSGYSGRWLTSIRCVNDLWRARGMWINSIIARCCDGIVSNTYAGLRMRSISKLRDARLRVLPNAVRLDPTEVVALPNTPPERLVLVMLGNIKMRHKGYDLAAQLARQLKDEGMQFELRIAGRSDEIAVLDAVVRKLSVESVIKFYGEVSHPEEFLRGGHLFLLLSRFEGMPNTLLEALNVGLPAIATEVGDLRALKERGAPFFLIPIENVSAAAEAVKQAVAQWPDTLIAASQGRNWVQEHFSEDACRSVLRNILSEILKA